MERPDVGPLSLSDPHSPFYHRTARPARLKQERRVRGEAPAAARFLRRGAGRGARTISL